MDKKIKKLGDVFEALTETTLKLGTWIAVVKMVIDTILG